jgi:hypothetical protein
LTRKRKRSGRRPRRPVRAPVPADDGPGWVSIDGRLMFVVGYTPGGSPYGVFEDEMGDFDAGDRTASESPFSRADGGVPGCRQR